jgi:hypothetical protein
MTIFLAITAFLSLSFFVAWKFEKRRLGKLPGHNATAKVLLLLSMWVILAVVEIVGVVGLIFWKWVTGSST